MPGKTTEGLRGEPVKQFSVFTPNKLGRLHDLVSLFATHQVHVLALSVLDTTESAILRLVVDDPERARHLLLEHKFPFTETDVLAVEIDSDTKLPGALAALLEAELNINYLYSFIVRPSGKSVLALNIEDREIATQVLLRHQFKVLNQSDLSR